MKTTISILAVILGCWSAHAQSQFTVQLSGANEVPPNASPNFGSGTFTLTGDSLAWSIGCPDLSFTPTGASVYGPAAPTQTALALFSLGTFFTAPGPQGGTVTFYQDSHNLLPDEIVQLEADLWYVNILSAQYPDGEIRGQVTLVPEPSKIALGCLGVAVLLLIKRRRTGGSRAAVTALLLTATMSSSGTAQVISDATSDGLITVTPGGAVGTNQWIGPWVDIPPTMTYVDGLPIVREPPRPPLPSAQSDTAPSSFPVVMDAPANWLTNMVAVPPGWSLIANPLFHNRGTAIADAVADNSVAELFKRVPQGTILLKFDNATCRYTQNVFRRGRWSHPRQTLVPGEGAFVLNPTRRSFIVPFSGNCAYGGAVNLPAGLSLVSAPDCVGINFAPLIWPPPGGCWLEWLGIISVDGTNYTTGPVVHRESSPCPPVPPEGWDSMSFNPQEGDVVYTYDTSVQRFRNHTFRNGAWNHVPVLATGQACFVYTTVPRVIRYTGPMPL